LQRLDIHPYLSEIDLCDYLIKYCQKNLKTSDATGLGKLTEAEKQQQADE